MRRGRPRWRAAGSAAASSGEAIARLETEFWQRLASSHGRAEALGEFETAGGGFQNLFARAAAYQARDRRGRQARSPRSTWRPSARSVVVVRPKTRGRARDRRACCRRRLAVAAATKATTRAAAAAAAVRRPGPAGSLLIVESNHTVPLVHVVVASRSGSAADPRHREGLTNLAAEWARRGAGGKSREELDAALDALGATLDVSTFADSTRFEGEVLARNLDAYLALVADILVRPTFSAAELDRTRQRGRSARSTSCAPTTARSRGRFFARNLYADHPYGHPPDGIAGRARGGARPTRSARTFAATSSARTWCSRSRATSTRTRSPRALKRAFQGLSRRGAAGAQRAGAARAGAAQGLAHPAGRQARSAADAASVRPPGRARDRSRLPAAHARPDGVRRPRDELDDDERGPHASAASPTAPT